MRRLSALHRALALVVLVIGTVTSAILPIADAYAERAVVAVAHVEAAQSEGCAPAHDELACDLCRVLRLVATSNPTTAALIGNDQQTATPRVVTAQRASARNHASASPRAPPLG